MFAPSLRFWFLKYSIELVKTINNTNNKINSNYKVASYGCECIMGLIFQVYIWPKTSQKTWETKLKRSATFTTFPVMLQLKSIYPSRSMTLPKSSTHIPNFRPFCLEENSPPSDLFASSCVLFTYYKKVCWSYDKHLMVAFQQIYESCHLEHDEESRILRRFVNNFTKALSNQQSDDIRSPEISNSIKHKRLNYKESYHRCHLFIFIPD